MMTQRHFFNELLLIFIFCFPLLTFGKVKEVRFNSKEIILDGKKFGDVGSYELLKGKIYYEFNPENYFNNPITDIEFARKNAKGLVEAWGDIVILQAVNPEKRSEVALVEVSNRGGKFSPNYFNQATKTKELLPNDPEYWGDGLLMEKGMTVIWVGWQFDVPEDENLLNINVPYSRNRDGSIIYGMVRSDWTVDKQVDFLKLGHRQQTGYQAVKTSSAIHKLTVRDGRDAPRFDIPRDQWTFAKIENGKEVFSAEHIVLKGGFQEGKIYELVYQSQDPRLVGLGLAALRDVISYAKYDEKCAFPVKQGIAAGVSQTGRFLRTFIYQGFNFDEVGRKAYDGMMVITAGAGRGSFNHRFAQPSRDGHRYSAFFYPTDIFPFTGGSQTDGEVTDELYKHVMTKENPPKIFYINTGYEYWGRAASLIHTKIDGTADFPQTDFERIYHLASAQHFVERFPPNPNSEIAPNVFRGNHLEMKVNYRALLVKLLEWVKDEKAPPPSQFPKIETKELVQKEQLNFPQIPDLQTPTTIHNAYRANYGEEWKNGFIHHQPPILGRTFPSLVPQVDEYGNEMGGIRNVEIQVPLATYTGWNLRKGFKGGYHELTDFRGTFIPFPKSELAKIKTNDPRPSILSLYPNKIEFLKKVENVAEELVFQGFLLERDIPYILQRNESYWEYLMGDNRAKSETRGPKKGKLMILGGGKLDISIFGKFKELAGGSNAKIVVIPTAGGDNYLNQKGSLKKFEDQFKNLGFKKVTVLHTRDKNVANTEKFYKPLESASGVWIVGGRQWRLMDAYEGTKTLEKIKEVLNRGGVVAGTSAGATIQGSYLARGDTKTNRIMMGDHEKGFSLMTNVAIDQHLLARNRQFDLLEITAKYPEILGIGLDENTGIVVSEKEFEVIGKSYVAIFDGQKYTNDWGEAFDLPKGSEQFYFLKSGDKYDLEKRDVVKE